MQVGELRVWIEGDGDGLSAAIDGVAVRPLGTQPQRHLHRAAVFAIPASALTPGWHEVVVSGAGTVILFPEALLDPDPAASADCSIDPTTVRTDPVHAP